MKDLRTLPAILVAAAAAVASFAAQAAPGQQPAGPSPASPTSQPSAGPPHAQPRIELDPATWSFETVWQGQTISRKATLRNAGNAPLTINEVKASCSCTVANVTVKEIAPGQTVEFDVTVDTQKRTGDIKTGIHVRSNDPLNPDVELAISGHIKPLVTFTPTSSINFDRITRDTKLERTVEIHNNYDQPAKMELAPAEGDPPPWDIRLDEVEPGKLFRLTAATRPPTPVGGAFKSIKIRTGLELLPELQISVNSFTQQAVALVPARLYVSRRFTRPTEQTVRVNYDATFDLKITELKVVGSDNITAQVVPSAPQNPGSVVATQLVRVKLPAGTQMPTEPAYLEIHTNHPDFPKLTVQFTEPPAAPGRQAGVRRAAPGARPVQPGGAATQPAGPAATQPNDGHAHEEGRP